MDCIGTSNRQGAASVTQFEPKSSLKILERSRLGQRFIEAPSLFAHPSTGDDQADHDKHVIWLGQSEQLDLSIFS